MTIVAVVLAAIAIVVIPAEILFRATSGKWYGSERIAQAAPVGDNDFRLYHAAFPIAKTPGRTRILVVGGSTTYGFGVGAAEAWPRRLAARLEARYPGHFEVVDVSYLGGHLEAFVSDHARASRRYIPRERWLEGERPGPDDLATWGWRDLDPDIVIVAPIVNDTAPDFTRARRLGRWPERTALFIDSAPLIAQLAISHYMKAALRKIPSRAGEFQADLARREIAATYAASLDRFVALWRPERRLFVVGLPWLFNEHDSASVLELAAEVWNVIDRAELADELSYFPGLESLEVDVRRRLQGRRVEAGLTVAEIARTLKALPFPRRLALYVDPLHATAEGHEMFATEIFELISTSPPSPRSERR